MDIVGDGGAAVVHTEAAETRSPATSPMGVLGKYRGAAERGARNYHAAIARACGTWGHVRGVDPGLGRDLAQALGCPPERAATWVPFLVAAHDVGKLQPGFLQKIDDPVILAAVVASGLPLIPENGAGVDQQLDHGLQSVVTLTRWLPSRLAVVDGLPPGTGALAQAVGARRRQYHSAGAAGARWPV